MALAPPLATRLVVDARENSTLDLAVNTVRKHYLSTIPLAFQPVDEMTDLFFFVFSLPLQKSAPQPTASTGAPAEGLETLLVVNADRRTLDPAVEAVSNLIYWGS